MDKVFFIEQMNRLNATFKGINEKGRIDRYYIKVENLPNEAMEKISDHFLDTFKYNPLPMDFEKAANEFKKTFFEKNGYYYNSSKKQTIEADVVKCTQCEDTGFCYVKVSDLSVWVFCDCEIGCDKYGSFKLPKMSNAIRAIAELNKFPRQAFIPKRQVNIDFFVNEMVREFKSEIRMSEKFFDYIKQEKNITI